MGASDDFNSAASDQLTEVEQKLVEAAAKGEVADLGGESVRAELVAALATGKPYKGRSEPFKVGGGELTFFHARIEGPLDISDSDVKCDLIYKNTLFNECINIANSSFQAIRFFNSNITELNIIYSHIYGQFSFNYVEFAEPFGATSSHFHEGVFLDNSIFNNWCEFTDCKIDDAFQIGDSRFGSTAKKFGISGRFSHINGYLNIRNCLIHGSCEFSSIVVNGNLSISRVELIGASQIKLYTNDTTNTNLVRAFDIQHGKIRGDLSIINSNLRGECTLTRVNIEGTLSIECSNIIQPAFSQSKSLNARHASIGGGVSLRSNKPSDGRNTTVKGECDFSNAKINQKFDVRKVDFNGIGGNALSAFRINVNGDVLFFNSKLRGGAFLSRAKISEKLDFSSTQISSKTSYLEKSKNALDQFKKTIDEHEEDDVIKLSRSNFNRLQNVNIMILDGIYNTFGCVEDLYELFIKYKIVHLAVNKNSLVKKIHWHLNKMHKFDYGSIKQLKLISHLNDGMESHESRLFNAQKKKIWEDILEIKKALYEIEISLNRYISATQQIDSSNVAINLSDFDGEYLTLPNGESDNCPIGSVIISRARVRVFEDSKTGWPEPWPHRRKDDPYVLHLDGFQFDYLQHPGGVPERTFPTVAPPTIDDEDAQSHPSAASVQGEGGASAAASRDSVPRDEPAASEDSGKPEAHVEAGSPAAPTRGADDHGSKTAGPERGAKSLETPNFLKRFLGFEVSEVARARENWLLGQPESALKTHFQPQPWKQLALVLQRQGYDREAREISILRRVWARKSKSTPPGSTVLSWILRALADYGFNPWRTVFWSLLIIVIYTGILWCFSSTSLMPGNDLSERGRSAQVTAGDAPSPDTTASVLHAGEVSPTGNGASGATNASDTGTTPAATFDEANRAAETQAPAANDGGSEAPPTPIEPDPADDPGDTHTENDGAGSQALPADDAGAPPAPDSGSAAPAPAAPDTQPQSGPDAASPAAPTLFVRVRADDFVAAHLSQEAAEAKLNLTYPEFNPLLYAFDVFVPLLDFGSETYWRANDNHPVGWWLHLLAVLMEIIGAIMVALIITGFTGLLSREDRGA